MKEGYKGVWVFYFYYAVVSLLARPICHLKSKTGRLIFMKIKDFSLQILDGNRGGEFPMERNWMDGVLHFKDINSVS